MSEREGGQSTYTTYKTNMSVSAPAPPTPHNTLALYHLYGLVRDADFCIFLGQEVKKNYVEFTTSSLVCYSIEIYQSC